MEKVTGPKPQLLIEHFNSPEGRRANLGGGAIYWWRFVERRWLGYRQGVRLSSWYARQSVPKGKQISIRIGEPDDYIASDGVVVLSFEEAVKKADEICQAIEREPSAYRASRGKYARFPDVPVAPPYLVVHALMDYHHRQVSLGRNMKQIDGIIRHKIIPHLGHIEVNKLTSKDIRDWRDLVVSMPPRMPSRRANLTNFARLTHTADCKDKRLGAANRSLEVLKSSLNLAFENEHCESDASWRRIKRFRRNPRKPPRFLDRDEIKRLVFECEPDLKRLVIAALLSGCRANELKKIKVSDYNRTLRRIFVSDDKTRKSRHVTLSREGMEYFDRISKGRPADDLLLVRNDGRSWGRNGYLYRLHRACNRAGIVPVVGLHDLRRTYASHAVMAGIPIPVVSKQLGHAKLSTTEECYLHLSISFMDDIFTEKMPDIIAGERQWHLEI